MAHNQWIRNSCRRSCAIRKSCCRTRRLQNDSKIIGHLTWETANRRKIRPILFLRCVTAFTRYRNESIMHQWKLVQNSTHKHTFWTRISRISFCCSRFRFFFLQFRELSLSLSRARDCVLKFIDITHYLMFWCFNLILHLNSLQYNSLSDTFSVRNDDDDITQRVIVMPVPYLRFFFSLLYLHLMCVCLSAYLFCCFWVSQHISSGI